jgi:glucokinase
MFIGIDVGGTGIKGIIADKDGEILASGRTPTLKTAKEINQSIDTLSRHIAQNAGIPFAKVKAIGVGIPGSIDSIRGKTIMLPNIPAWRNYPVVKEIEKLTGKKVFLENDANIAVMGEQWLGRGAKFKNWFMLTLGTGIGGGAIVDGRLLYGRNGVAAEFGHITVDHNGRECPCGSHGCFEQYASAPALVRLAQSLLSKYPSSRVAARIKTEPLSAHLVSDEFAQNDPLAVETINTVAYYLGVGISSLANVFNPEAVIIGGGLSRSLGHFLPGIRKELDVRGMKGIRENIKILAVKHEDKGPALGAVKIAMDRLNPKNRF